MKRYSQRRGYIPDRPDWDIRKINKKYKETYDEMWLSIHLIFLGLMILPFFIRFTFGG